jgi:paraquat-inducible protein B
MPETNGPDVPEALAQPRPRWRLSIVWLVPLVALLIGGWLAVRAILEKGPVITVVFKTAEGVEAGKTMLKYKNVEIGKVLSVSVARDLEHVVVTAEVSPQVKPYLVDDTRFWVVRPRIAGASVTGLGTLLAGTYVAVDRGTSAVPRRDFVGLDDPPPIQRGRAGREYLLRSAVAGSLGGGSPVLYRQLKVGEVTGARLAEDGQSITTSIFIDEPYTRYVTANSRFWNASGLDMKVDASGVDIETQSLAAILIGGVAFDTPRSATATAPAPRDAEFSLFPTRAAAMRNPETEVLKFLMVFRETTRGLQRGAPVDFRGVVIGEVVDVSLDVDAESHTVVTPVEVNLYPERLRWRSRPPRRNEADRRALIDDLVAHGLRAQLNIGNLLTGQRFIALDFFPNPKTAKVDWTATPAVLPTTAGGLQEIQTTLSAVADKLEKLPLQEIGADLRKTLATINTVLQRIDTEVTPEARDTLAQARKALGSADRALAADQPLQQDAREAMREVGRAAQSLRVLADYLEQHPESLIRGKKKDEK